MPPPCRPLRCPTSDDRAGLLEEGRRRKEEAHLPLASDRRARSARRIGHLAQPALRTESSIAIPLVDLRPSWRELRADILADIAELLDSGKFHYGPQVAEFETRFAEYCEGSHCVGIS